jgi:hypothetical protein
MNDPAQRISALFHRRYSTPWTDKESRQYNRLLKDGYLGEDDLEVIERYYVYQRRKENGIHRRDLYTFLNNYAGELDRARAWDEDEREKKKRRDRRPLETENGEKPVSDSDFQRLGELARLELSKLKSALNR